MTRPLFTYFIYLAFGAFVFVRSFLLLFRHLSFFLFLLQFLCLCVCVYECIVCLFFCIDRFLHRNWNANSRLNILESNVFFMCIFVWQRQRVWDATDSSLDLSTILHSTVKAWFLSNTNIYIYIDSRIEWERKKTPIHQKIEKREKEKERKKVSHTQWNFPRVTIRFSWYGFTLGNQSHSLSFDRGSECFNFTK